MVQVLTRRLGFPGGRRDCDFSSGSTLPSTCITGGCLGGLECTQSGVPPATLAEFNLAGGGTDYYDLSAVGEEASRESLHFWEGLTLRNLSDGSNLPMEIYNSAGCDSPKCTNDINAVCPSSLSGVDSLAAANGACFRSDIRSTVYDSNGYVVGC